MNKYMEEAKAIRAGIEAFSANQTDESLIDNMAAFPYWNGGSVSYSAGMLLQYDSSLYRIIQQHTSQADWTPDKVPALFTKVSLEEWPEWVRPTGSQDAYAKDAKTSHNSDHWISDYDGNVWEPGVFGWSKA